MNNLVRHGVIASSRSAAGPAPSSLFTGLVAYWALDEASGTRADSHTNSLDLTDNNTVGQVTGNTYANAADFVAAQSEYLSHASNSLLQPLSLTFSMWVKPDILTGGVIPFLSKHDSVGTQQSYLLYYYAPTAKLYWAVYHPDGTVSQPASAVTPMVVGNWYHIVVTVDDQNELQLIINNGTPAVLAVTKSLKTSTGLFGIGAYYSNSSPISLMDGAAGPVSFWNRVLTSSEITTLHNSGAGLKYSQL